MFVTLTQLVMFAFDHSIGHSHLVYVASCLDSMMITMVSYMMYYLIESVDQSIVSQSNGQSREGEQSFTTRPVIAFDLFFPDTHTHTLP